MEIFGLGLPEVVLAVICFFYFRKVANDDGLIPWDWPVVGMLPWLLSIAHDVHDTATVYMERLGGTYLLKGPWFTNMDIMLTVDPANVRYILGDNFLGFKKGDEFHEIFDILGDGVVNSEGDLWRIQRKHSQFLFSQLGFRRFLARTNRDKLENGLIPVLDRLSQEGVLVDMQEVLQRLSFDSTVLFITGYDPGCLSPQLPDIPFCKAMDESEELIFTRHVVPQFIWKLQRLLNIGPEKRMRVCKQIMDEIMYGYISKKREELSLKGITSVQHNWDEEGVDLLTLYLTEEDKSLALEEDDKFVRDIVLNHILAGRDTTSSALTWFLWLVITHPVVKAKIRAELLTKIPENEAKVPRLFSEDELNDVPYLNGALNEALRLYPPVPFQRKEPIKPDILPSGHHIHPKMRVMFSLYAMGRMSFVWGKDSCEFKPERWITEKGTAKFVTPYKFTAFSAGPRTCLGTKLAYTQMKAVAAALVHNYDFHLVEGHKVVPNNSMILLMKHGLKVRVAKRWS